MCINISLFLILKFRYIISFLIVEDMQWLYSETINDGESMIFAGIHRLQK